MHMDVNWKFPNFYLGINVIKKYHKLQSSQLYNAVYNDEV